MIARCLHGGGIPVVYTDRNDREFNMAPGGGSENYRPNPNGFFSIENYTDFEAPSFYNEFKGKLLKIPRADFRILPRGRYKVIFMLRDPREILASYRSFIGRRTWGMAEGAVHFYDMIREATIKAALSRGDMDILEVNYNELLKDPVAGFERIKAAGWPIDVQAAAALVDLSLYRHRIKS